MPCSVSAHSTSWQLTQHCKGHPLKADDQHTRVATLFGCNYAAVAVAAAAAAAAAVV
jgi:hypothetical protein